MFDVYARMPAQAPESAAAFDIDVVFFMKMMPR